MRAAETVAGLSAFERRGAGSNSERRAALWLAAELQHSGWDATIAPFWCRPNWALAHAWHVGLGLAGSLLSVHSPRVGGPLIVLALLSLIADSVFGRSLGRRLTPERASQNVIARAPEPKTAQEVRLVIVANYDAGRTGLVYRDLVRVPAARFTRLVRGITPGWLGWIAIALVWLVVIAILRLDGSHGTGIGVAQLLPTVALVLTLAALLDVGSADFGPAAGDNATGVAVAIALARALAAAAPRRLTVELVLEGAGDVSGIGLRRYLRASKGRLTARDAVVLGVAACAAGSPRWWRSDGALVPLSYFARLRELCERIGREDPSLGAEPHRGRGAAPAQPARNRGIPAIAIGCLDDRSLSPRSHQQTDTPDAIDDEALDRALEFGLLLVDAIDANLDAGNPRSTAVGQGS